MRSLLFVPGDSEAKLVKSLAAGADVVIVDLEDSVAPAAKSRARAIASEFLRENAGRGRFHIRVNDLKSGETDSDLDAVMAYAPEGVMLPKATNAGDIDLLAAKLRVREAERDLRDGQTWIVALITETPGAVLHGAASWRSHPRLAGLTWGAEDLSAAVGALRARDAQGGFTDVFRLARAVTVLACAVADVPAIDTVFTDFRDENGLRAECEEASRDGFTAKLAIHPAQVPIINEAFTPSAEAVAEARAIVAAFQGAASAGVVALEGRMLDRPHLERAERLLARARGMNERRPEVQS